MISHVAFIMDGNRRHSKKKRITLNDAYKQGMEQFIEFVRHQVKYNIKETSFFALSKENYEKRSQEEKNLLFKLVKLFSTHKNMKEFFIENNIHLFVRGDISNIGELQDSLSGNFLEKLLLEINSNTKNPQFKVNIALNYNGQEEIVHCVKQLIKHGTKENEVSLKKIKENLWFNNVKAPEVIVRSGDAPRLSGFLLWDSAYSEIYLTKKLWPELDEEDFKNILDWFSNIKRNFGK